MSGPKISDYILHPWRVAEIRAEWERQCAEWREQWWLEEKKKLELEEQASLVDNERSRQQTVREIGSIMDSINELRGHFSRVKQDIRFMQGYEDMSSFLSEIDSDISDIDDGLKPYDSSTLEAANKNKSRLESLKSKLEGRLKYYEDNKKNWDKTLSGVLDKALDDLFAGDPEEEKKASGKEAATREEEKIRDIQKEEEENLARSLLKFHKDKAESLSEFRDIKEEINRQAKVMENLIKLGDVHGAVSFYYQKVKENAKLDQRVEREREEKTAALLGARASYETACAAAGVEPEKAPENADIKWYEDKRTETEAAYLEEREKQIISDELSSIMEEMGYHVIAEKETVRKSGKKIKEEVFSFGEGSAVNITEANGQITMEIVGLDTSTRMPEEDEQEYLKDEMVTFCTAHKDIEAKLNERGIVLKNRIQMNPPSREYAKILNVTSYDRKEKNISMIQERKKKGVQRSAAAAIQKSM